MALPNKIEIRNEIKSKVDETKEKKEFVHRSVVDIQRIKLEKLMKNPEKPVIIPESQKARDFNNSVPTFVRNVMGSSAGAGSGEFHVYRNLRRKEYARLKAIDEKSKREEMDEEFKAKLDQHQKDAEDRTAKKREKRLKKKQKGSNNKKSKPDDKKEWKPLSDDELLNEESDPEIKNDETIISTDNDQTNTLKDQIDVSENKTKDSSTEIESKQLSNESESKEDDDSKNDA